MNVHFLSGLPRSGSTVLAAILNQNPQVFVSTTSGLSTALNSLANTWHQEPLLEKNDKDKNKLANAMRGLINSYYDKMTQKPNVIDKARIWPLPVILSSMTQVLGRKPRIIATVRSVPDCMASFVRVAKPESLDDFICKKGGLKGHLKHSYEVLQAGYEADPSCFLFVEYEDLLNDPYKQLKRIHEFLKFEPYDYNFEHIDASTVKEDDEELYGLPGLHDIKPKLERQHKQTPQEVLGYYYPQFCQPEFWLEQPRTKPVVDDLDLQLTASTLGNFEEGKRIADKLKIERPNDNRAAFNRGWYELQAGNFEEGYKLLHQGRKAGVFGNTPPNSPQPEWNGKEIGTILIQLEGGLGDQIHQLRYAKMVRSKNCKVIVSCTISLVAFIASTGLADVVIQHGTEYGVYHDYWMSGMSAPIYLNLNRKNIDGAPYINRSSSSPNNLPRIGLRWSGNKAFEAQHHKLFPPELFFNAVKREGVEFISLQRDADLEFKPDWVKTVPLDTWNDTHKAISSCDLVISSCTSVSHLAAAMGVPTWVIIPVMSYYLYAEPGESTPYYNSMKLFRQERFGNWAEPFQKIINNKYPHELLSS